MRGVITAFILGCASCAASAQATGIDPRDVYGAWYLHARKDKMTDELRCDLGYVKSPYIWVDEGRFLTISFHGRGGVASYQYRIGTAPAVPTRQATRMERETSTIQILVGDPELGDARNIYVRGLSVVRSLIEEDIDLTGLREAKQALRIACTPAR